MRFCAVWGKIAPQKTTQKKTEKQKPRIATCGAFLLLWNVEKGKRFTKSSIIALLLEKSVTDSNRVFKKIRLANGTKETVLQKKRIAANV